MAKGDKPEVSRGRGRPPLQPSFLAAVAKDYVYALGAGLQPVKHVADQRRQSIIRARGWVHLARRDGYLLGSTGRGGKATGRLSAKALRILKERG